MAKQDAQPDGMSTPLGGNGGDAGIGSNTAPHLAYHDLRKWLEEARAARRGQDRQGLSWQQDIGMVSELAAHTDNAPCFVFEDVPGTLPGSRVLINFFDGKRKNMTLGFPTDLNKVELSEGFRAHYAADLKRIPPKFVETGPVMQNVLTGDADRRHASSRRRSGTRKDGGRYIGTGCYTVIRDPDEGWINCGTYRVMVHDENTLGLYISPGKHGRQMRDKYKARGEPMPIAVVLGGDPMSFLMGCSEVPYGVSEYEVIGGMRGSPVEVIKGPVTGLPIPANAEIVIEGFVEPDNMRTEGPFGEWTGYYATGAAQEPVIDIKAIYHRNEPILLGCRAGAAAGRDLPLSRDRALRAAAREHQQGGRADVTAAWAHEVGNARLLLAIAINQRYPGHAKQAGHIAAMCHVGAYCGRYVIVVDDDIDVSDLERGDVGAAHALRSGDLDRHHPRRLVDAARSAHRAGAPGGRRLHQQPRRHRCLPAVPLAGQVPGGEHADARGQGAGAAQIRPSVHELTGPDQSLTTAVAISPVHSDMC